MPFASVVDVHNWRDARLIHTSLRNYNFLVSFAKIVLVYSLARQSPEKRIKTDQSDKGFSKTESKRFVNLFDVST